MLLLQSHLYYIWNFLNTALHSLCVHVKNGVNFRKLASIYLSIFLYVLTPEGDFRRVPGNQVLGVSFLCFFFVSFCAMLVVLVVSERRASACLIMLSAK